MILNRPRAHALRVFDLAASVIAASTSLLACTHVKPDERGKLAHPSMTADLSGPAAVPVYDVHEGATGGGEPGGGGCGCN